MGRDHAHRTVRRGRGAAGDRHWRHPLSEYDAIFAADWWGAVAGVTRAVGDLGVAEDAVQDACSAALVQWPADGVPAHPGAWLRRVARNKAIDRVRRDARRRDKEVAAMTAIPPEPPGGDDELALIFMCCHPALSPEVRVSLTLRSVCGLTTDEIAAAFLVPPATMAKRLVRAKQKIRESVIPLRVPAPSELPGRLDAVLRVVYLVFTAGHWATSGPSLVRPTLCDTAVHLARELSRLLPDEPEARGLLALLRLTDARRPARTDSAGQIVLLEDQDRGQWDKAAIAEGRALLESALRAGRPGRYQLWAAIAACHSTAPTAAATDWREIAALYHELLRFEPTAIVEANRAVAVAMAEGPAAGLVILDTLAAEPRLARWPQFHLARGDLLRRQGSRDAAVAAYRQALELEPPEAERAFIRRRLGELAGA